MEYRYIIPDIPPSNNKFLGRENRWEYQNIKKQWAELIAAYCRPRPEEPLPFKDNRRRDPDNYSGKMILDGLTKAGIIADDSFSCIDLQLRAVCDKKGITEIFVQEIADEDAII